MKSIRRCWKCFASLKENLIKKTNTFSWQHLLDKFPFRENLFKRKVIVDSEGISFLCGDRLEYASHLFVTSNLASSAWDRIFKWLGVQSALSSEPRFLFEFFLSLGTKVKSRGDFAMIWHAVVWTIWSVHNDKLFYGSSTNVKEVEDKSTFWLSDGFSVGQPWTLSLSLSDFRTLSCA